MRRLVVVLGVILLCEAAEVLVFEDDFNEFDLGKWEHQITLGGGGNFEFQAYRNNRSNSYVRDGILYLKPTLTADEIGEEGVKSTGVLEFWGNTPASQCTGNQWWGCHRVAGAGGNYLNPIMSAAVRTTRSAAIDSGRVEVRAKLPKGDWLWPAIWMLQKYEQYGTWPASGEIDIMESRGNVYYPHPAGGVDSMGSALHWGPASSENRYSLTNKVVRLNNATFHDDFHTFGLYFDRNQLYTYIDDVKNKVMSVTFDQSFWQRGGFDKTNRDNPWAGRGNAAPFDKEFYLIINLAVGGTGGYFPDNVGNKPWSDRDPHAVNSFWDRRDQWLPSWQGENAALQIDSVRMWKLA